MWMARWDFDGGRAFNRRHSDHLPFFSCVLRTESRPMTHSLRPSFAFGCPPASLPRSLPPRGSLLPFSYNPLHAEAKRRGHTHCDRRRINSRNPGEEFCRSNAAKEAEESACFALSVLSVIR